MTLIDHSAGGYRFLPGIAPFSSGVAALPGFRILRAALRSPLPYQQGFALIERHLAALGRPLAALCAVEMRMPAPLSFQEFADFNQEYLHLLASRGLLLDGQNPAARTNVVPLLAPPAEPVLSAYSYTVPCAADQPTPPATFVIAGAAEFRSRVLAPESVVRSGETTDDALQDKVAQVLAILALRLSRLHLSWQDATTTTVYTAHPLHGFLRADILPAIGQPAALHGIHWCYSQPPIAGVAFEMDMRGVGQDSW